MCIDHKVKCACGRHGVSMNFRDGIMPAEVISRLYCPDCSGDIRFDAGRMVMDNKWVIEFDMEVANFCSNKMPNVKITPDFIFDEGYCTWRGVYPTDNEDSVREREELIKLSKVDKKKYFEEFRKWSIGRMQRLSSEGWRKAVAEG